MDTNYFRLITEDLYGDVRGGGGVSGFSHPKSTAPGSPHTAAVLN